MLSLIFCAFFKIVLQLYFRAEVMLWESSTNKTKMDGATEECERCRLAFKGLGIVKLSAGMRSRLQNPSQELPTSACMQRLRTAQSTRAWRARRFKRDVEDFCDILRRVKHRVQAFQDVPLLERVGRPVWLVSDMLEIECGPPQHLHVAARLNCEDMLQQHMRCDLFKSALRGQHPIETQQYEYAVAQSLSQSSNTALKVWRSKVTEICPNPLHPARDAMKCEGTVAYHCKKYNRQWRAGRPNVFCPFDTTIKPISGSNPDVFLALEADADSDQLIFNLLRLLTNMLTTYDEMSAEAQSLWDRREQWPDRLLFEEQMGQRA